MSFDFGLAKKLGFVSDVPPPNTPLSCPETTQQYNSIVRSKVQVEVLQKAYTGYVQDANTLRFTGAALADALTNVAGLAPQLGAGTQPGDSLIIGAQDRDSSLLVFAEGIRKMEAHRARMCTSLAEDVVLPLRNIHESIKDADKTRTSWVRAKEAVANTKYNLQTQAQKADLNVDKLRAAALDHFQAKATLEERTSYLEERLAEVTLDAGSVTLQSVSCYLAAQKKFLLDALASVESLETELALAQATINDQNNQKAEMVKSLRSVRDQHAQQHADHMFDPIVNLLKSSDGVLVVALMDAVPSNELEAVLDATVRVLDVYGHMVPLLARTIAVEVESNTESGTLFRGVSLSTRLLSAYAKPFSQDYLRTVLGPTLLSPLIVSENLEVATGRLPEGATPEEQIVKLADACTAILTDITSNLAALPIPLRQICRSIFVSVTEKFRDAGRTSIGGFLFLRLIIPALSAPDVFGLVSATPSATMKRNLLLVASVLQKLSNEVSFGLKEPYFEPLNTIFNDRGCPAQLRDFLDAVIDVDMTVREPSRFSTLVRATQDDLPFIENVMRTHLGHIGRYLESKRQRELAVSFNCALAALESRTSFDVALR